MFARSRERFNENMIEVQLQPGERVRLWKRVPIRHDADPSEVASKLKLFNKIHIVVRRVPESTSRYIIRAEAGGKEIEAS